MNNMEVLITGGGSLLSIAIEIIKKGFTIFI